MWRCFEHLATMAGMTYVRWENPDPTRFRADGNGDYTRVDVPAVRRLYEDALRQVRQRVADTLTGAALLK